MSRAIAKPITKSFALNITFDSVDGSEIDIDSVVAEFKQRLERLRSGGELSDASFTVDDLSVGEPLEQLSEAERVFVYGSLRLTQDKIAEEGVDSVKVFDVFNEIELIADPEIQKLTSAVLGHSVFVAK